MKTLIVNNHTKYLKELCSLFSNAVVIEKENLEDNFDSGTNDLLVFSGGLDVPTVLRHPEKYINEMLIIKKAKIPIIGICLGMEIITKAFGGELQELPAEHRGAIRLEIEDEKLKSFIGADTLEVAEGHHIGIKNLPKNFVSCAHSGHGIEIIKHQKRPIIGLQFHPEVSKNTELIKWMIETLNLNPSIFV